MTLDTWSNATFGLSIVSLISSVLVAIITITCVLKDRTFASRTSFRLSLTISLATTVSSTCHICTTHTTFMQTRPPLQLRVICWLTLFSELCVVFLSLCITIHLLLITVWHQMRVARVVQKWYECVSVFVALAVTHPVVYMGHSVTWDPRVRALLFDQVDLLRLWQAWPVFLGWVSLCVVANSIMLLVICARMLDWRTRAMNSTGATSLTSSSTNCSNSSSAMWAEHFVCPFRRQQQRHEVRLVALRIGLYALVPVVTEIWAIAYALARGHAMWLKEMASVMACTQGVVCLLLLAVNPACDGFWLMLREHRSGLKEAKREEQCLNFCHLDASTIHLSPYHSRSNSIS